MLKLTGFGLFLYSGFAFYSQVYVTMSTAMRVSPEAGMELALKALFCMLGLLLMVQDKKVI